MGQFRLNKRFFNAFLMFCLGVAMVFTPANAGGGLLANTTKQPKKSSADVSVSASKPVDRINKAIEEAKKKLGINPLVDEVRVDPLAAIVPVPAEPFAFKSADPRKQADELAWKAHRVYADKERYWQAHELADQALKIYPDSRLAKNMNARIDHDIKERPMDLGGTDRVISSPEGRIALTVALSDGVVTLDEAQDIAIKGSMMLESLRHRSAAARSKVHEAFRAFFPTAGFEASAGGGRVASGGASDVPYDSQKYMLTFSQPVFYGGELLFTLKQAEAAAASDELKYQKERADALKQVGEAYRGALNAGYNLEYQQELYRQMTEHKERHDKEFKAKLVAEIEHLEITSVYNQVTFQKETAITTQKSANLLLCQAMGVNASQVIPVNRSIEFKKMDSVDMDEYLGLVSRNNYDIKIKRATLESAYYGARVFDAQRQPRVDIRGNAGVSAERAYSRIHAFEEPINDFSADTQMDLEKEYAVIAQVSVPWGENTTNYSYQRRIFAPSVSSFQGSEDFKNSITTNFYDRLSHTTDEEIAKADYLKAMAELQKERADQEINARQAYYEYESALLQLQTSESKIFYRERQVKILEQTTKTEEAKITELLNELVNLTEDRYSKITSISNAKNAQAKMEYLAGVEGANGQDEVQLSQK